VLGGNKITFSGKDDYFKPTYELSIELRTDMYDGLYDIGETLDVRANYEEIEYGESSKKRSRYKATNGTLKLMNMEEGNTNQEKFYQGEFSATFVHIFMNDNNSIDTSFVEITEAKFLVDERED